MKTKQPSKRKRGRQLRSAGVVRCQWIGCKKPAKHKIIRANTCVCDEHLELNTLRFGCLFETERVNR